MLGAGRRPRDGRSPAKPVAFPSDSALFMKQVFLVCGVPKRDPGCIPPLLRQALEGLGCQESRTKYGLKLFTAGDLPIRELPHGRGWVIGHLFDKSGRTAPAELEPRIYNIETDAIVDRYWGGYVAVIADAGEIRLLRDP